MTERADHLKSVLTNAAGKVDKAEVKGIMALVSRSRASIEFAARLTASLTSKSDRISNAVLKSRNHRLAVESADDTKPHTGLRLVKSAVEAWSLTFFLWGPGDVVSIVEGVRGQEFGGRRLDKVDRGLSVLAGVVPIMPATPLREMCRTYRVAWEESTFERRNKREVDQQSF